MLFAADFETTTDENDCRVWAWGVCEIGNPDYFVYGTTMESFMEFMQTTENSTYYFHNARFDTDFIFCYLFEHGYKHVTDRKKEATKTFSTLISKMGQYYSTKIVFEKNGKTTNYAKLYDSLKLFPNMSVDNVSQAFGLPLSKLKIDYKAYREVGHVLTDDEVEYLHHDVKIMALALEILFSQGLNKMTVGSNAMKDYKEIVGEKNFERWFPTPEYDSDIRRSYKGGFTFLNPLYREKDVGAGLVFDVNSLYPSVMRYSKLPYGNPVFFEGEYQKDDLYDLYVQRMVCMFELKEGYIPTIQIKKNLMFVPTEYLTSSNGEMVELYLTSVDLELFKEHYNLYNVEYICGWKFKSTVGLFNEYIDKWTKVKIDADKTGNKAMRTIAKLMLNNLYGKFSLNPEVQSKIPYYDDGRIKYTLGEKEMREAVYIPVGTFITAWARYKTITNAQKLYDIFIYADTDSLHLDLELPPELRKLSNKELAKLTKDDLIKAGVKLPADFEVDPYTLGAWKLESRFTRARFIRQKCYMEDWNAPETWDSPDYNRDLLNVTCAGMPKDCHQYVTWDNFKVGTCYKGKLQPKHVRGGTILIETEFTIKPN